MSMAIKQAKFQGDPGLFGFLGKAARSLGSLAVKTLVPAPFRLGARAAAGAIASRISPSSGIGFTAPSRVSIGQRLAGVTPSTFGPARPGIGTTQVTRTPGFGGALKRLLPGGATGFEVVGQQPQLAPKGFHLNKTGYFLSSPEEFGTFVAPFTRFVRNRRRNPGNMRAADRAVSRIESAKRMAKRLGRISIRKKC